MVEVTRTNSELNQLAKLWHEKIVLSAKDKEKKFGCDAKEIMRFYEGPHDFIYNNDSESASASFAVATGAAMPNPGFKVTVNKTSEYVQLFLPSLYHRNPDRLVEPKQFGTMDHVMGMLGYAPMDPMLKAKRDLKASLVQWYLNYTPNELDLKAHGRQAVFEALIKGRGCLWAQLVPTYSGRMMVGSFYDSVDNLFVDPDATSWRRCAWIARKRRLPVWEVERMYSLPAGYLKANAATYNAQAEYSAQRSTTMDKMEESDGKTSDCIEFYEVYSRMGMGGRLKGAKDDMKTALETYGDFCYLAIAEGVPFPLNVPPSVMDMPDAPREIFDRTRWPAPFYEDATDPWPVSILDFQLKDNCAWPMPPLKPAIGYQLFLDWAYSFLACRIKNSSRQFIFVPESINQEFKDALLGGSDSQIVEIQHKYMELYEKLVNWVQAPEIGGDLWKILQLIEQGFEKASGLNELMYAQSGKQIRSAAEADMKREMANIRPDDMAEQTENFMTMSARKEALLLQTVLEGKDIAPAFGEHEQTVMLPDGQQMVQPARMAQVWDAVVKTDSFSEAAQEFDYRIEAGSIRKPNKARQEQDFNDASQMIVPILMQTYQMSGDPSALNEYFRMWFEMRGREQSIFVPDLRQMMAQQQAPPPVQGGPPQQMR